MAQAFYMHSPIQFSKQCAKIIVADTFELFLKKTTTESQRK